MFDGPRIYDLEHAVFGQQLYNGKRGGLVTQVDDLTKEVYKLKAIVAELVDFVYADKALIAEEQK